MKINIDEPQAKTWAQDLVAREAALQDSKWGSDQRRHDKGQLLKAAAAQLIGLQHKHDGVGDPFGRTSVALGEFYPKDWAPMLRDYGSSIANLVVAGAFIQQEIKRLFMEGEDAERAERTRPYPPGSEPFRSRVTQLDMGDPDLRVRLASREADFSNG